MSDVIQVAAGGIVTAESGVVAFSTGGQASAKVLTAALNRVSTVAAAADSVRLPAAIVGSRVVVINQGASPVQVFGAGTDTINGIATATGVSQGVGAIVEYFCTVSGNWETNLGEVQRVGLKVLTGDAALSNKQTQTYMLTKGSAAAITLAAPVAATDDGLLVTVVSASAFAHVLTATGLLKVGTASVNVATFAAFAGASLRLMAYDAKWYVLASNAITFS